MTGWGATGIWNVCLDGEDSTSEYTTHAYSQCWVNNVQHSGDREDNPIFNGGGFIGSYTGAECARFCDDMSNTDQHGRTCVAFEHSSQDYNAVASCALAWGCDHTEHWSGGKTYIRSSETCMDASTANNGQYNTIFDQPLGSSKAITFTVRANNDAHVGFFSNSKSLSEVYEIVIGGWGNSWSVIRESNQGANQVAQATSQIVSGSEDRDFWASAENGLVQLGLGHKIGEQVVLAWQDPNSHEAMYVGVMTGWGADGVWDVCLDDPEPKTCSAHSDCPSKLPFCYEGFCADCSECHFCHDGIDGTCGTCGEGFPTKEQGSCGNSGPKICLDASTANNG